MWARRVRVPSGPLWLIRAAGQVGTPYAMAPEQLNGEAYAEPADVRRPTLPFGVHPLQSRFISAQSLQHPLALSRQHPSVQSRQVWSLGVILYELRECNWRSTPRPNPHNVDCY